MKILIVSDSWPPVISGPVRTYQATIRYLRRYGHEVEVISPDQFTTVRCPTDTHLRLALFAARKMARLIEAFDPDALHIVCEAPLGIAARNWCVKHQFPFTTSYTTKLPEHLEARTGVPAVVTYPLMRWFHRPAAAVMVSTDTLLAELTEQGFANLVRWSRGVDLELFRPGPKSFLELPRPIQLCVGRVAPEKNIEAFLKLDAPGTKVVVGDGPLLRQLKRKYPEVQFVGSRHGQDLVDHYAAADVFVFPSRTDTFGLVLLEALACGVPVAAFPVAGPLDVIGNSGVGVLDEDLGRAMRKALQISPVECRRYAQRFSWEAVARQFVANLHPVRQPNRLRAAA
jgi:glycosyltransferase involved in cell wall biosynthesis